MQEIGKFKCRFSYIFFNDTIAIGVIEKMNEKDELKMRNTIKQMIRLKIKPNFTALSREYRCYYRTAKIRYYKELNKKRNRA